MPPLLYRTSVLLTLGMLLVGAPLNAALAADRFQSRLATAVKFYEASDYESALEQLVRARQAAKGDAQETVVSLYEGMVLYRLGRLEDARSAFDTALVLDPTAKLPGKVPMDIQREFEAARTRVSGLLPPPEPPSPAPKPGTDRPEQAAAPTLTPMTPSPPLNTQVAPSIEAPPRRIPVLPIVLVGTGVVAGSVGAYFGVNARQQIAEARVEPFRQTALAKLEDARGNSRAANILFGTAGLALVGAVVTWFFIPQEAAVPTDGAKAR